MAIVTYNRSVKQNENAKVATPFAIKLDFAGVTPEQLQDEASDNLIVKLQGAWRRTAKMKDNKLPFATIVANATKEPVSVKKLLENSRKPGVAKPVRIAKEFAKLSPEAKKALLAELSKNTK